MSTEKISVIIPVRNEAKQISKTLASTQLAKNVEVIVVDGGSQDNTVEIVQSSGVKVIVAAGGRAQQMNAGAAAASGEILLFLHADTRLPPGFDRLVRQRLFQADTVAGAFQLKIDSPLWSLRLIELGVNWRSRWLQMPYGDQAIFLRTKVFHQLGGFPQLPIMEDFQLMRQLRHQGKIAVVSVPVITSGRRWLRHGVVKTTLLNQIIILSYLLGVSPERLVHWYRGKNE